VEQQRLRIAARHSDCIHIIRAIGGSASTFPWRAVAAYSAEAAAKAGLPKAATL
jgi:hypothetical protein